MAESMKDFEQELEASFKKIEEGDIITGTVVSVDETGVVLDLKYYAEGFIPAEEFSREPGFNIKEAVQPGEEIQATVLRKDDGQGNILLSRAEAADVLAWDKLKELQESGEALEVIVKGIDIRSQQEIMIGRSSQYCQIILTEQDISRKHCSIKYEYQGSTSAYYVTDYSTFGVIVNDSQKLEKGVTQRLPKGTKLTLGQGSNEMILG